MPVIVRHLDNAYSRMNIIKATQSHKQPVLKLLDDFRTEYRRIISPEKKIVSATAQENGGSLFEQVVNSPTSAIFLAEENGKYLGIISVNALPQVRYGRYIAEIEEMFVYPEYQGKGAAMKLLEAVEKWAREKQIKCIRLESGNELKRGHGFYEKAGFRHYAKGYEKVIA